jgi:hypothetical protein
MMTLEQFELVNDFVTNATLTGTVATEVVSDPIYD